MNIIQQGMFFNRNIKILKRLTVILNTIAKHGMLSILESSGILNLFSKELSEDAIKIANISKIKQNLSFKDKNTPQTVRTILEDLGPVFVKLGQFLASREEFIPSSYIQEFKKLQNNVRSLPFKEIEPVLIKELGVDYKNNFENFDSTPIASGSIAQVYKARYKNEDIVIKVKRPNISEIFKTDLFILEKIASILEDYFPESKRYNLKNIVEDFTQSTLKELDFKREAATNSKFKKMFENTPYVYIPTVYWELSGSNIIVLSYIEHISNWQRQSLINLGLDPNLLVERGVEAILKMIFEYGFLHGDLHEGNILIMQDNKIGFIDFGLVLNINKRTRYEIIGMFLSLLKEDYDSCAYHLLNIVKVDKNFDIDSFIEEISSNISPFMDLNISSIPTITILQNLIYTAVRHGVILPNYLIILFKTLASLENIVRNISPEFNMLECFLKLKSSNTELYSIERFKDSTLLFLKDSLSFLRSTPKNLQFLLKDILSGDLEINVKNRDILSASSVIRSGLINLGIFIFISTLLLSSVMMICFKIEPLYKGYSISGIIGTSISILIFLRKLSKFKKLR